MLTLRKGNVYANVHADCIDCEKFEKYLWKKCWTSIVWSASIEDQPLLERYMGICDKIESFLCLVAAGAHNLRGAHKLLVAVMLAYLVVRGATLGSLFRFCNGKPHSWELFVKAVRKALTTAGASAQNGVEDSMIITLGKWQSSAY